MDSSGGSYFENDLERRRNWIVNVTKLCGKQSIAFWDDDSEDFGDCFASLFLVFPAHAFLAIASAYYLGKNPSTYYIRTQCQKIALYSRTIVIFLLAASPALAAALLLSYTDINIDQGLSGILETVVQIFSWILHFGYTVMLYEKMCPSPRGDKPILFILVYVAAVDIIQARSILIKDAEREDTNEKDLETRLLFGFSVVRLGCLTLYLLTLLPSGDPLDDDGSRYEEFPSRGAINNDNERSALLGRYSILDQRELADENGYHVGYHSGSRTSFSNRGEPRRGNNNRSSYYGGISSNIEPYDPTYLGIAKEHAPWLSKLVFYWVYPLIRKGRLGRLKTTEDLFDVPVAISAPLCSDKFQQTKEKVLQEMFGVNPRANLSSTSSSSSSSSLFSSINQTRSDYQILEGANTSGNAENENATTTPLLKIFFKLYWRPFMAVGALRFLADCFGFASPMLLNLMVKFMEDKKQDVRFGYLYAAGLLASTISVAICITHFNLLMCELNLKVRACVITAIYRHTLSLPTYKLQESSEFSVGQVINNMSIDADRIVNFSPSMHALWSLPFQFIVSFYLLYSQLGSSVLAGIVFTIVMIPINKVVANMIGKYSTDMMKAKDERVKCMSEVLQGIRVIKYFLWEAFFTDKVNKIRKTELKQLAGRKYMDAVCVFLWAVTPVLISVSTFATFVLMGGQLSAAKVFTSIALFQMLTGPLNAFPWVINGCIEAFVSIKRISKFLAIRPFKPEEHYNSMDDVANREDEENAAICAGRAKFSYGTKDNVSGLDSITDGESVNGTRVDSDVSRLNFTIKMGEFVGIVGKVGSGKTSVLKALLGEMRREGGQLAFRIPHNGIGYVQQDPWLQQGTVRDNILYGKNYQPDWYDKVINACALKEDFDQLPKRDQTNVGEKGAKLSGGQKARVALARAVYQDKEVYLIDDIFSAIDLRVGIQIYHKTFLGLLKHKTRILVTHHPRFLTAASKVIAMENGETARIGRPREVLAHIDMSEYNLSAPSNSKMTTSLHSTTSALLSSSPTPINTPLSTSFREDRVPEELRKAFTKNRTLSDLSTGDTKRLRQRTFSNLSINNNASSGNVDANESIVTSTASLDSPIHEEQDEDDEVQETGVVKFGMYKFYANAVGKFLCPLIFISLVLMEGSKNSTDIWLAKWVSNETNSRNRSFHYDTKDDNSSTGGGNHSNTEVKYYLSVYAGIAGANSVFAIIRSFLFAFGGICAAKIVHQKLLKSIVKGKFVFFDTTPTGRILNRVSSDLKTVDDDLPFILNIFLAQLFGVVCPIIVCAYAVPWICLVLLPVVFILYDYQAKYRPASRDLKRIGSVSLSPIYSHFSDTINGLATIRAMRSAPRFIRDNEEKVEANQKASYASTAAQMWLEFRLQAVGCAVVTGIAIIAVIEHKMPNGVSPGLVGLAISYALGITSKLSGLVSSFTETEREMVAVERCHQYIEEIPEEDLDRKGTMSTPYGWPSEGIVHFKDVKFRYRAHLPLALKDFNLETKSREKVGIVGRTGSGKSSLFQALFRTTEISNNEGFGGRGRESSNQTGRNESSYISIDGVNIQKLSLRDLRQHLAIIPQQPFLFSATLRDNLDPLKSHNDAKLWDSLKKARLSDVVKNKLAPLDPYVGGRGLDAMIDHETTFSAGQRQLLCLARAILSSATIVCVDEATANVDLETDRLVQDVLKSSLSHCTVITIAHRVETVLGSDRVIVMSEGKAIEVGHPNLLLQNPDSEFSKHVNANN